MSRFSDLVSRGVVTLQRVAGTSGTLRHASTGTSETVTALMAEDLGAKDQTRYRQFVFRLADLSESIELGDTYTISGLAWTLVKGREEDDGTVETRGEAPEERAG